MNGWRLAFRLAKRDGIYHKARTALVALMIALPVASIVFAAALVRTMTPGSDQAVAWKFGTADVILAAASDPAAVHASESAVRAALPSGTAIVEAHIAPQTPFRARGGSIGALDLSDLSVSDRVTRGIRVLRSGRAPSEPGDVAVSPSVLEAAGATVGETIELLKPSRTLRVTGIVVDPALLDAPIAVAMPETVLASKGASTLLFVDIPGSVRALASLGAAAKGWSQEVAAETSDDRGHRVAVATLLGGVALVVAALVASAALAVAARRHLRHLGLLATSGASHNQLRGFMTASGALVGLIGSAAGIAAGIVATIAVRPFVEGWAGHVTSGSGLRWRDPAIALALGVVTTTASAWVPAFAASRIPILSAIGGRRPLGRVRRRVPIIGVAVAATGLAAMGLVAALPYADDLWSFSLAGAVAVLLGATIASPWIVSALEPLARVLHGSARLAIRSLIRQRTRAAAVVAAVMAAASITLAGSAVAQSNEATGAAESGSFLGADQVVISGWDPSLRGVTQETTQPVAGELRRILPDASAAAREHATVERLVDQGGHKISLSSSVSIQIGDADARRIYRGVQSGATPVYINDVWVAGPELVAALGAPRSSLEAAEQHGVAVFARRGGALTSAMLLIPTATIPRRVATTAIAVETSRRELWGSAFIDPARVTSLGFSRTYADTLVRASHPITGAERHRLALLSSHLQQQAQRASLDGKAPPELFVEYLHPATSSGGLRLVLLVVALLFTLGVVALGLALSAADGRDERAVLDALGAPPSARRRIAVLQSVAPAALGGLLAIPVGFGPAAIVMVATHTRIVFPWTTTLGLVAGVPLAVGLAVAAGARLFGRQLPSAGALAAD